MNEKFLKSYNPQETEPRIYKKWEESGFFNPDNLPARHKEPFTIMMPPPNVTGVLHMGHAMMLTIEDMMIRYERMRGKKTLWLPGTDHAAIATQSKVEKEIAKKESKNRFDLGREELLKRVGEFAQDSHDTIISQIKTLGASCDWSREAFTLDEKRNLAVRTVFKKMHDDGLIYRGHRIVNWDPKGQTTISDDEIVYEEREAKMYTFKYFKDFPISISTTRPETKVGDTAVAVHPEDERYKKFIGQEYDAVFCGVPLHIKIIADKEVDKDFGTGALGVTPMHSQADWEIAERHNLPKVQVINEYAKMMIGDEKILNKKTTEAREIIVEWLKKEELLEKEEIIKQNISTAERTGGIIEPLPKLQWFVAVNKPFVIPHSEINGIKSGQETTLKEIMKKTVENEQIKITPDYFSKTYFHWIDNLNDWCISRQIWYGHRIPVWYKDSEIYCGTEAPKGSDWKQDEDTLDTWFSAALWTFSTLGWPEKTKDLELYHPTNILETGYEIIFFWVARMIMMTGYNLGTIPFKNVYFHGTVRDAKGRKMSKSLGNGLDPIEVAQKFGMDAGRLALIIGTAPGTDSKIDENKIRGYKNFANKVWNITRFVLTSIENFDLDKKPTILEKDQKTLDNLKETIREITTDMDNYRFYLASEKIYHYIWHTFADIIIEESKPALNGTDEIAKNSIQYTLYEILTVCLKLLHPFMPFVTEEIWTLLPQKNKTLLLIETWPK
ncbi:MAG: valine--tRNA ligase [Candidatus Taylorbacteria bacterium RIFOXYD2_FULL_36_9]|uniref:Valine--tRNA ligase n=1 Tax=Candidatus Taylorbacteria bacterium RIFOXYD2_FULL_36_9 TaxID=1802338 RepID=A0A1G2PGF1_9BACT|nr:MAG: valine--tRNA ligase [Candidatus Taylorbacteria bacterium RIFOXYD2_FULL_36_9]